MKRYIIIALLFSLSNLLTLARPARSGIYTIYQPDGTSFQSRFYGDEFFKHHTTLDGYSIIKGEDGWWYYAAFNEKGEESSSGYRVGDDAPTAVLNNSFNFPYEQRVQIAQNMRSAGLQNTFRPELQANESKVKRALIILAQYKDVEFEYSRQHFVNMLTQEGYSFNGGTGSAKEYFEDQFNGQKEFIFDVSPIVTLPEKREYYGANGPNDQDCRPAEMIIDACELAHKQGVTFSQYDENNDNYVDIVFVFFAGGDEAENINNPEYVWSHAWYAKSGGGLELRLDGKYIDRYACTAELAFNGVKNVMTGIGTFCHEYSHTMDLPDLYDTDYTSNGWGAGTWNWTSLMDGGNANNSNSTPPYFNAIEREILGIAQPIVIEQNGTYTLSPIHSSNQFYRINTPNPGEYYLLECRKATGWDEFIHGSGMLLYHIDKSSRYAERWTKSNTVNAYSKHQCADIIEADGRVDEFYSYQDKDNKSSNIQGIFFPNSNTKTLHLTGKINMTSIRQEGDDIKFSIIGFPEDNTPPVATDISIEAFMDAAIINFSSSREFDGEALVTWERIGGKFDETLVYPFEDGKYSLTLTGLVPGNKTYEVTIEFVIDDIYGECRTATFMTTKASPVDWPYIFVGKDRANEDGTFPKGSRIALMAYNTDDAEEVIWTFNGKGITAENDGYFTLEKSGVLRAHVYWEDGNEDIIEKRINVSDAE